MSVPPTFPAEYVDSFMEFLAQDQRVTVLTYADLDYGDDWNFSENYPEEYRRWKASLADGSRDPERIYVFLQHDVDSAPELTSRLLSVQEQHGVRSCVMIHNKVVLRSSLQNDGVVELADYPVDREQLKRLEALGWVVGYHSNALERGGLNFEEGARFFQIDVEELRREFTIDFFCPHGGARDAEGRSNVDLGLPSAFHESLRWTLNRHTIKFDGVFSDGRWMSRRENPEKLNLREFVKGWKPGRRYRMLLHPQYYGEGSVMHGDWLDVDWYAEVARRGSGGVGFSDWWPAFHGAAV